MSSEYQLQVHVVRYLEGEVKSGKNVTHITKPFPAIKFVWGAYQGRSKEEGFFLKAMGVRAGVHDLHIIYEPKQGQSGYCTIELKVGRNKQSLHQDNFSSKMITCGHKTATCYSVAQVRDALISFGLDCANKSCLEPPPSEEEMRKLVTSMYKPVKKMAASEDTATVGSNILLS